MKTDLLARGRGQSLRAGTPTPLSVVGPGPGGGDARTTLFLQPGFAYQPHFYDLSKDHVANQGENKYRPIQRWEMHESQR